MGKLLGFLLVLAVLGIFFWALASALSSKDSARRWFAFLWSILVTLLMFFAGSAMPVLVAEGDAVVELGTRLKNWTSNSFNEAEEFIATNFVLVDVGGDKAIATSYVDGCDTIRTDVTDRCHLASLLNQLKEKGRPSLVVIDLLFEVATDCDSLLAAQLHELAGKEQLLLAYDRSVVDGGSGFYMEHGLASLPDQVFGRVTDKLQDAVYFEHRLYDTHAESQARGRSLAYGIYSKMNGILIVKQEMKGLPVFWELNHLASTVLPSLITAAR